MGEYFKRKICRLLELTTTFLHLNYLHFTQFFSSEAGLENS